MKTYIREMINDLITSKAKDFVPAEPKGTAGTTALPEDLSNQELSANPEEKVKQLDYQAHQSERLQTNS
jgi:hypothetical protein